MGTNDSNNTPLVMKPHIEPKIILALTLLLHSATHAQQLFPGPATTPAPPGLSEMPWMLDLNPSPPGQPVVSVPLPGGTMRVDRSFGPSPLAFERNDGQVDAEAKFLARGPGYHLFLTQTEAVMVLNAARTREGAERLGLLQSSAALRSRGPDAKAPEDWRTPKPGGPAAAPQESLTPTHVLRLKLVGANPSPAFRAEGELPGKVNYFIGKDPGRWHTNISTFAKVRFEEVYPGIGLVYYGHDGQLEYDFIVAPGADAHQIALAFDGADEVALDDAGELVLRIGERQLRWRKPLVYQQVQGARHEIAGAYRLEGRATERGSRTVKFVSFEFAAYDPTQPLVIDPALMWGTFLGGADNGSGARGIVVDANGNVYINGQTQSARFPTTNALQSSLIGANNGTVTKLDPNGQIVYSTYIAATFPYGIAVDSAGSAHVVGRVAATDTDFPVVNALQPYPAGGANGGYDGDAYILKLSPEGSALVYSTYLGGSGRDAAYGVAVDGAGNACVCGSTSSWDFPVTNAFQPSLTSLSVWGNAFIAKLTPAGTAFVYSTYLGGTGSEEVHAVAADAQGNAYVGGFTSSADFPTLAAFQSDYAGGGDAFFATLDPAGALTSSSFFGGTLQDVIEGIAVGKDGDLYLGGRTYSTNLPTANALQPRNNAHGSALLPSTQTGFVARYNPASNRLVFSTYLGGSVQEYLSGLAVDSGGTVYVSGDTYSGNFPHTADALQPSFGGGLGSFPTDGFFSVLSSDGSRLIYSTFLGGSGQASPCSVALDLAGNVLVAGDTTSSFPVQHVIRPYPGSASLFVLKFSPIVVPPPPVIQMPTQSGNKLTLTWSALPGRAYQVQFKTDLAQTNWTNLGTTLTTTNTTAFASDTRGADPQRFYRIVLLP
jgi:hypothetical protein